MTPPDTQALLALCNALLAAQAAYDEVYDRQAANPESKELVREFDKKSEALDDVKTDENVQTIVHALKSRLETELRLPVEVREIAERHKLYEERRAGAPSDRDYMDCLVMHGHRATLLRHIAAGSVGRVTRDEKK